jgi:transcriptional regulator with XRE-family HTH domain
VSLSSGQIRAARAFLRWSAKDLAERSGVSVPTIQRLETTDGPLRVKVETLDRLQRALEGAGVEFLDRNGVRLREEPDRV